MLRAVSAVLIVCEDNSFGVAVSVKGVAELKEALQAADPVRAKVSTVGLAVVDEKKQALWMLVVNGLVTPAESGNAVAVDGLAARSVATNQYVRNAVVVGLKRAAANQNAKATETLRSMGVQ